MTTETTTNYSNWIEFDYNPFILFSNSGEIISLNQSAQFLTSKVNGKTLYEVAIAYAPLNFGYKTTFIDLRYDVFNFFAVTIGYENDNEIGMKLYQSPYATTKKNVTMTNYETANIYLLIDACILNAKTKTLLPIKKEFDPTLPDLKLAQNQFIKVVGKMFEAFTSSKSITATLMIKTGEFLQMEGKKYQILLFKLTGDTRNDELDVTIDAMAQSMNVIVHAEDDSLALHIPVII